MPSKQYTSRAQWFGNWKENQKMTDTSSKDDEAIEEINVDAAAENPQQVNEQLVFELYVDESGVFDKADDDWLIGGYVRPVPADGELDSNKQAEEWWKDICDWFITNYKGYVGSYQLAHCSPNGNHPYRTEIQSNVLEKLLDKIEAVRGFPVVFFCPKGECSRFADINYLSVLGHGYVEMLNEMRKRFGNPSIRVIPIISKTENTREMARTAGQTDIKMLTLQYRGILGSSLFSKCSTEDIDGIVENLKVIHRRTEPCVSEYGHIRALHKSELYGNLQAVDRAALGRDSLNIHNVIADYICNSYYGGIHREELLKRNPIVVHVQRNMAAASVEEELRPAQTVQHAAVKNAEDEVIFGEKNIDSFNLAPVMEQRGIIRRLCEFIRPSVQRQIDMENTMQEIEGMLSLAEQIVHPSVRAEMKANLLLFQIAILNHLGEIKRVEGVCERFKDALNAMSRGQERNTLTSMFFNRQIVLNTDRNDYEIAEANYRDLEAYWSKQLEQYGGAFGAQNGFLRARLSDVVCPELGKAIGSILQTSRHRMRTLDTNGKFSVYFEALNRAYLAKTHLEDPADLARMEQTLCDVESEAGYYDEAFQRLYKAASLLIGRKNEGRVILTAGEVAKACAHILSVAGKGGRENPFLLSHYVRLISEIWISGSSKFQPLAQWMLDELLKTKRSLDAAFYQDIRAIHPRTQILWKLGSVALRTGRNELGNELFKCAFEQLLGANVAIFSAIGLCVCAEWALLSGADAVMLKTVRDTYLKFLTQKPFNMIDAFGKLPILTANDEELSKHLFAISRVMAY